MSESLLHRKRLMLAPSSILPSEYQRVEYLESTGEQYIDTGIAPLNISDISIDIRFAATSVYHTAWCFGAMHNETNHFRQYSIHINTSYILNATVRYGDGQDIVRAQVENVQLNTIYEVTNFSIAGVIINGEKYDFYQGDFSLSDVSLYLFAVHREINPRPDDKGYVKIYSCTIRNGVDTYNLIPCYRKLDSKPGMYDIVNRQFYTNQGTGEFIVGPDINQYTTLIGGGVNS